MAQWDEPLLFEPEKFTEKYPEDPIPTDVQGAAEKLAATLSARLPGENDLDARQRVDQSFDHLKDKTITFLEGVEAGERLSAKQEFIRQSERAIEAKYQQGIERTTSLDNKSGGQFARDEEIRLFKENVNSNDDLKEEMKELANKQAERREVVENIIDDAHDGFLKTHDLDQVEAPQPTEQERDNDDLAVLASAPLGSEEFKAALARENAAIVAHKMNERLLPDMRQFNSGR